MRTGAAAISMLLTQLNRTQRVGVSLSELFATCNSHIVQSAVSYNASTLRHER
jgi:hypothetical protein